MKTVTLTRIEDNTTANKEFAKEYENDLADVCLDDLMNKASPEDIRRLKEIRELLGMTGADKEEGEPKNLQDLFYDLYNNYDEFMKEVSEKQKQIKEEIYKQYAKEADGILKNSQHMHSGWDILAALTVPNDLDRMYPDTMTIKEFLEKVGENQ